MQDPLARMARAGLDVEKDVALQYVTAFLALATLVIGGAAAMEVGVVFGKIALGGTVGLVAAHALARHGQCRPAAGMLMLSLLAMPTAAAFAFESWWVLPMAAVPAYPAVAVLACCPRGGVAVGVVTAALLGGMAVVFPHPMVLSGVEVPILPGVVTALGWTVAMTLVPALVLMQRESIDEVARALANIPDFTAIVDPKTRRVLWTNQRALDMLGHQDMVGMPLEAFTRPDSAGDDLLRQIERGRFRATFTRADGSTLRADVHISVLSRASGPLHVAVARDVGDLEHQLVLSERRASVGQLSGGLVHDFNNC